MKETTEKEILFVPPDAIGHDDLESFKITAGQTAERITQESGIPYVARFRGFGKNGQPIFDYKPISPQATEEVPYWRRQTHPRELKKR